MSYDGIPFHLLAFSEICLEPGARKAVKAAALALRRNGYTETAKLLISACEVAHNFDDPLAAFWEDVSWGIWLMSHLYDIEIVNLVFLDALQRCL